MRIALWGTEFYMTTTAVVDHMSCNIYCRKDVWMTKKKRDLSSLVSLLFLFKKKCFVFLFPASALPRCPTSSQSCKWDQQVRWINFFFDVNLFFSIPLVEAEVLLEHGELSPVATVFTFVSLFSFQCIAIRMDVKKRKKNFIIHVCTPQRKKEYDSQCIFIQRHVRVQPYIHPLFDIDICTPSSIFIYAMRIGVCLESFFPPFFRFSSEKPTPHARLSSSLLLSLYIYLCPPVTLFFFCCLPS